MAVPNRAAQIIEVLSLTFESSEDEADKLLPVANQILDDENNDEHVLRLLQPVVRRIQRIQRVKIFDYIENVVTNYIHDDFVMHFRLSREVAYELIARFTVSPIFSVLQAHAGYEPLTPEKHILSYLWFVGHESASYRDVAYRFKVTIAALHSIITRVTSFIMSIAPSIIRFPTLAEKNTTSDYYLREKRFPGIIGSIDGSHIRIDKPVHDKDSYINRKQYFSIQLQGVVDHQKKFIDV